MSLCLCDSVFIRHFEAQRREGTEVQNHSKEKGITIFTLLCQSLFNVHHLKINIILF